MNRDDVYAFMQGMITPFGGVGIALAVGLLFVLRLVVPKSEKRLLRAPLVFLVLSIAITFASGFIQDPSDSKPFEITALALLVLSVARSLYLLILHGVVEPRRKSRGRLFPGIFRDIIQGAFYAIGALVVLHEAGVEATSLLTTSALLTAVVGLSLQDTLGNLFAGLAIQTQEPFEVGDWIQFDDDSDHTGEVLEINWRATRILTIDRIEVTVPNNLLAKAPIRNYSKPTRLVRRSATIVAPSETPPARVHRLLAEAIVEVEGVRSHPPPDIQTIAFTERGIEYRVRYFIEDFEQREIFDSRVRDRLWYALRRAAVPIPAVQRRITMIERTNAMTEAEHVAIVADVEKAIERVPIFAPLSHELLHELAIHTERRLYAPGEIVIQQGDYGEELFIVERGELDVLVDAHDGMQHVATLRKDQFFGEMSLMTGEQRAATVRTDGEVSLLVVSKEALQPLLEVAPDLVDQLGHALAEREQQLGAAQHKRESSEENGDARRGELMSRIREFFSI
ncbi:MAG: cyclic nucleotide-binding domain-containing protein [Sandaracinaceae bacterium]